MDIGQIVFGVYSVGAFILAVALGYTYERVNRSGTVLWTRAEDLRFWKETTVFCLAWPGLLLVFLSLSLGRAISRIDHEHAQAERKAITYQGAAINV